MKLQLHEDQQAAIDAALDRTKVTVITGGAGTGKTTIIQAIASSIAGPVKLCAFAGKAAARLREATGRSASTIHRMLMYRGDGFALDTLRGSTVIVDEASMVDSALMAEICRRSPKRLILVGDEAQLPPVGRGQPFHDLIAHRPELVSNLTFCWRNQQAVFEAATAIRNGIMPASHAASEDERWTVQQTGDAESTQREILRLVRAGAIEFEGGKDVILAPKNGEPGIDCTVRGLNAAIADVVNPRDGEEQLKVDDRAINTKNNADLDVWNGTTGRIHAIDDNGDVWFEPDEPVTIDGVVEQFVRVPKQSAKYLQLGYALSVHKSQGSQYRRVVVCCLQRDSFILDRALTYTAVTRTKSQCLVAGQSSALRAAIGKVRHKWTTLQELTK